MKVFTFLMLVAIVHVSASSYSQNSRLSLNMKNASIKDVLIRIEEQTEYRFLYSDSKIDVEKKVNIDLADMKIEDILNTVFEDTNIGYRIMNWQILLSDKTESSQVGQQPKTVTGKVTDSSGQPLPGVTVVVKGTTQGIITDFDGKYSLANVSNDATLVFSFVGMKSQEVPVAGKANINVTMSEESIGIEEVVAVAYGQQKKTSLTSAVSTMKVEKMVDIPTTNLSMSLGGRLNGVIVRQSSGQPGNDGNSIYIRGISSTGSTQPLIIVDGVPREFSNLDPNTIESITVLKDAAATAPYGIAAANGVILVTTKRGKTGVSTLSFNVWSGIQNPTVLPEIIDAYNYAKLKNEASINVGSTGVYSEEDLQKFKDGSDPDGHPNWNVYDKMFAKNAPLTNYSFQLSGGAEKTKYYASAAYQHQAGLFDTHYSNRFNYTLGLDADITKTTKLSVSMKGMEQLISTSTYSVVRLFELVNYATDPTRPLYLNGGELPGDFISAALDGGGNGHRNYHQLYSQISIEQDLPFIPGLKAKGIFAFDPTFNRWKAFRTLSYIWGVDTSQDPYVYSRGIFEITKPSLAQSLVYSKQLTSQASLFYNKTFGKNNISALTLFEAKSYDISNFGASRVNYNLTIDELSMGSSDPLDISNSGASTAARQMGLVYRLNYDHAEKYLFEVTGRYDGHYYFAPGKRWGFFPAFSAGWRISEESFMQGLDWLDNLKIRGSYGEVGALAGNAFQYLNKYNVSGPTAVLNGLAVQSAIEATEANTNITWERAKKTDVGVDATFWGGLLNFEADYFYEKRSNMLIRPETEVPAEYGIGLSQENAGVMENWGVDLNVGTTFSNVSKDLRVSLSGNLTYAKNKLLKIYENDATYNNPNRRITGRSLYTKFGYESLGYFQVDDFDANGKLLPGIATQPWSKVQPGDVRYKDMNGDGKIDVNDQTVIGHPNVPGLIYGFTLDVKYKRFALDALFQGVGITDFYGDAGYWQPFYNSRGAVKSNLDYWTPENQNASHSRITPSPPTNNTVVSSYLIFNASYLRLKSLNISYAIPDRMGKRIGIQNARVYVSGQNLLTFTSIINYDPEILQSEGFEYPLQRVISVGASFTLF